MNTTRGDDETWPFLAWVKCKRLAVNTATTIVSTNRSPFHGTNTIGVHTLNDRVMNHHRIAITVHIHSARVQYPHLLALP